MIEDIGNKELLPPMPQITEETRPFWDSCKEGVLKLQRCSDCSSFRYPPGVSCPICASMNFTWELVSGEGSIFSFVRFDRLYHKAFTTLLPYVVVIVELNEGPRLLSRLVGLGEETLVKCGAPVKVRFEPIGNDLVLPLFELVLGKG